MKYVSWGMTVLFISWAYFQWNDPDSIAWIMVYLIAAAGSALHARGMLSWQAAAGAGLMTLAWSIDLCMQFEWVQPLIEIEMWREAMGLLIVVLWAGVVAMHQYRSALKSPAGVET